MKITRIVDLHADAGWRVFSFLKIETDAGIVGWSEYNESYGSKGLTGVILKLAETLVGQDPRPVERITANLYAKTRQAPGGLIQQAIAAIEHALVDVKAKALGVPVCEMLGGPVHDRLRLYWSHCGTYRLHHAEKMGLPQVRNLDDIRKLGEHVRERGFTALKTNIFLFDGVAPELYMPGFVRSPGGPELNPSLRIEEALDKQLAAFREGTGKGVEFLLDLNFNFKTEGYVRLVRALEQRQHRLMWVEIDSFDPRALALIRRSIATPLASCESLFGRRQFKDFLENYSMDVGIVDLPWNGILEFDEDRRHGRGLRAELRAAQLLRPHVDADERPLLRGDPELPHHGDRHRRRALEGRSRHRAAAHRERALDRADEARLGRRCQ